ncbi:MAG: transposase, partial [Cellulosilyticum sp.]|nr:transposase [Cellulosilyticum sp.]
FDRGRNLYTFENRCNEDTILLLGDDTKNVFLNTQGKLQDVDDEMLEFLKYIEHSNNDVAAASKSPLVKAINEKVSSVKEDKRVVTEYMTLLERDREKFQEGVEKGIEKGIEQAKLEVASALLDVLEDDMIALKTGLSIDQVRNLRKQAEEKH